MLTIFIFKGKLEILVGKSNGLCYYIWEALENMGPDLRGSKFFCSFLPVQLTWIFYFVAGHSPTMTKFIVLCLGTRFLPGWFVYMVSTQSLAPIHSVTFPLGHLHLRDTKFGRGKTLS